MVRDPDRQNVERAFGSQHFLVVGVDVQVRELGGVDLRERYADLGGALAGVLGEPIVTAGDERDA